MSEQLIQTLRDMIAAYISGKRLLHTYAVERECLALGDIFSKHPSLLSETDVYKLRIAALLHDITKEKSTEEHIALAKMYRVPLTDYDIASPKVLHAKTGAAFAAAVINKSFSYNVVDDVVRSAIFTHTTGAAQMSLVGKLLYLADYIEDTRTFEDCVILRQTFYSGLDAVKNDPDALLSHLDTVMLLSFDMTIRDLLAGGAFVNENTTAARNALLFSRMKNN